MTGRHRFSRSPCPIANVLDLVGDKWSLLIVRDLLRGQARYSQLAAAPEKIPTNILADRLQRLERADIIARAPYQERPRRYAYTLTQKGRDLSDILVVAARWAKKHLPGTKALLE